MKKWLVFLSFVLLPTLSHADFGDSFQSEKTPLFIFGGDTVYFGVDNSDTGTTCSWFRRQFKFDATTSTGQTLLSILLLAVESERQIDVWYDTSTVPGDDELGACDENTISTVTHIGLTPSARERSL